MKVLDQSGNSSFVVVRTGIYYLYNDRPLHWNIRFYDFSTSASRIITNFDGVVPAPGDLSVSPDGKTFLYGVSPTAGADLFMIENFR